MNMKYEELLLIFEFAHTNQLIQVHFGLMAGYDGWLLGTYFRHTLSLMMKNHEYRYFMLVFELGWLMLVQVEIAPY